MTAQLKASDKISVSYDQKIFVGTITEVIPTDDPNVKKYELTLEREEEMKINQMKKAAQHFFQCEWENVELVDVMEMGLKCEGGYDLSAIFRASHTTVQCEVYWDASDSSMKVMEFND